MFAMATDAIREWEEQLIRQLGADDEAFLWIALYYALHVPAGGEPLSPDVIHEPSIARYVSGWMQRQGDVGVIAERDRQPIGAAWLRRWSSDDHGFGYIDDRTPELSMSVLPDHRNRGLGTQMLRSLLAVAAEQYDAVSLSVSESNSARRLYEREGFTAIGESQEGSLTMRRPL